MARRVGTSWSGVGSVLTAGLLSVCGASGCYEHHTADEELLDIPFPDDAYPDAGVHAADASTGTKCTGTDPIALFLCQLTAPSPTARTGTGTGAAATPSLQDIITLLGGLGGATGTGTGTGANSQNPLAALTALLGGSTATGTGTGTPTLADILTQLGLGAAGTGTPTGTGGTRTRDAGAGRAVTMPTAADCVAPTDQVTQFICMLQKGTTSTVLDAGPATVLDAGAPAVLVQ
ncbi:MAG: hypothetical protein JWN04_3946 [Myxococcaceae bacterium]|nr:hypothetical protein [Myxococcaceae bacterium]